MDLFFLCLSFPFFCSSLCLCVQYLLATPLRSGMDGENMVWFEIYRVSERDKGGEEARPQSSCPSPSALSSSPLPQTPLFVPFPPFFSLSSLSPFHLSPFVPPSTAPAPLLTLTPADPLLSFNDQPLIFAEHFRRGFAGTGSPSGFTCGKNAKVTRFSDPEEGNERGKDPLFLLLLLPLPPPATLLCLGLRPHWLLSAL